MIEDYLKLLAICDNDENRDVLKFYLNKFTCIEKIESIYKDLYSRFIIIPEGNNIPENILKIVKPVYPYTNIHNIMLTTDKTDILGKVDILYDGKTKRLTIYCDRPYMKSVYDFYTNNKDLIEKHSYVLKILNGYIDLIIYDYCKNIYITTV